MVNGRTVIVATGAQYRKLDLPELERYEGLGVYYAATQAEGQMCAGDPVLIVGGGNSAGQAAMFLSQHAASCRLMIRGGDLGKSMSRYLIDELENRPQVELMTYTEIVELKGEPTLEAVVVVDKRTGERRELEAKALFVFIGADPHTDWLRGHVAMDEHCFLLTGRDLPRQRSRRTRRRTAAVPRDEPARHLRGRRRPLGLGQARRLGGRRGLDGRCARAPAPRRAVVPKRCTTVLPVPRRLAAR